MSRIVALRRLVPWACSHPVGTVCRHRQREYDVRIEGYLAGMEAGLRRAEERQARGERIR